MTTTYIISVIAFLIPFVILYLLSDTITEVLSDGDSFAPNETKPFK